MSESRSGRDRHLCDLKKNLKTMDISAFSHSHVVFPCLCYSRAWLQPGAPGHQGHFQLPPSFCIFPLQNHWGGSNAGKAGNIQLQIFGQESLGAILEVFSPLLCKQVVVLGEKGQVFLAAFAISGRAAQAAGETGLAAFACLLSLGNQDRIWG